MSHTAKNSSKSSAVSGNRKAGSPSGKASAISGAPSSDQKKQKLTIWPEWNENDVNSEKWEVGGKAKEGKSKPTSAATTHGFEDSDPKFDWPQSILSRIDSYKRPSELFEKTPIIVDQENGLENFDLLTPNEHLHNSETMRWIISQIHSLWEMCKKEKQVASILAQYPDGDYQTNKAFLAGRLWRPWEHIYALNKVVKGPFIPIYNPHGKYVVRLFFMGCWRKLIIDDLIPVDKNGRILLPQTTINGELWPILLSKALMKIISLDINSPDSATEFNDVNIISCFTGWLPEPLPLRFGHMSELWRFLKETLPKYQWPEEKAKLAVEEESTFLQDPSEFKEEPSLDAAKEAKGVKKTLKDGKSITGKDTKMDKHKKDTRDKKGKATVDDTLQEESFSPEFSDIVVFASFSDLPLNKLSASTEMADRRERLRKYNLNHDFSNPVWLTCTRDIPLEPPPPPEKIPVWKTIRQRKKVIVPSDEPIPVIPKKPDQFIELKSPYVNYKTPPPTNITVQPARSNSRFSNKIRSRPQTVQEIDEADDKLPTLGSESKTEFLKPASETIFVEKSVSEISEKFKKNKLEPIKPSSRQEREKSIEPTDNLRNLHSVASNNRGITGINGSVSRFEDLKTNIPENVASTAQLNGADATANANTNPEQNRVTIEIEAKSNEDKSKLWMDLDDFFVCFKSVIVYHKPSSFKFSEKYSDLKQITLQQKLDKKKDVNQSMAQLSPSLDEKSPRLLFVDSLTPIELIVSFSSLGRWYEQKVELPEKISKASKKVENMLVEQDTMSLPDSTIRELAPLQHGSLMAEPYSWKSLVTGQPLLRIHTTSIRSSFLSLPPGRHVLKFLVTAPIAYHINIISNTKFAFGDEEEIMPKLTDESCRFLDQAMNILKSLLEAIKSFNDPAKQKEALNLLYANISPLTDAYLNEKKKKLSRRTLNESFQIALYELLKKVLGDAADMEMAYAWKVFLLDTTHNDILGVRERRPETSSTVRGSAKKAVEKKAPNAKEAAKEEKKDNKDKTEKGDKQDKTEKQQDKQAANATLLTTGDKQEKEAEDFTDYFKNHPQNEFMIIACTKIQAFWRKCYIQKLLESRSPGSARNLVVCDLLKKAASLIEQNAQENSIFLFRTLFKVNPDIMPYYSFYKDEWNKISYSDYNGSYADQPSNTWFILFRDIFFVNEDVFLLPKLYCNLNNCSLRVINNDTLTEIPKVFNKVSPYTYVKNKKGYTIIAESKTAEQPVLSGRWRLRLIGSSSSLLTPKSNKTDLVSIFEVREARDYYVPNENKTILRYKVSVTEDTLTTLMISTSKPDVYIKFTVYDNGEEVCSVSGKGVAEIPGVIFFKDRSENDDGISRPGSKTLNTGGRNSNFKQGATVSSDPKAKDVKGKRSTSANSDSNKNKTGHSRSSSRQSFSNEAEEEEVVKAHKYIIEATVLKDSWPLSLSQWAFVNTLKENEAAELKIFSKDRTLSPSKESKMANTENKAAALKAVKAKTQKAKTSGVTTNSRPNSSSFDITKPNWTLKWVTDVNSSDTIEIKKDNERVEEIKALKRAWESHEAGRCIKALNIRSEFLKSHLVRVDGAGTDDEIEKVNDEEISAQQATISQTSVSKTPTEPSTTKSTKTTKQEETKQPKGSKPKGKEKVETKVQEPTPVVNEPVVPPVEEELTNRPPTPPKPKVYLPPLDVTPFLRSTHIEPIYKDKYFQEEQTKMRKAEFENYLKFKDTLIKFREEERKYRLQQKLKQVEECESLQSKLDQSRKEVFEPREAFRQIFLEAERKRLEDMASQEANLASQLKTDGKDKKKGSAGKKKK